MRMRRLVTAAVVAASTVLAVMPAEALTAIQYKAQGHGRYLHSSGTPVRYHDGYGWRRWPHWRHRRHHRYYR